MWKFHLYCNIVLLLIYNSFVYSKQVNLNHYCNIATRPTTDEKINTTLLVRGGESTGKSKVKSTTSKKNAKKNMHDKATHESQNSGQRGVDWFMNINTWFKKLVNEYWSNIMINKKKRYGSNKLHSNAKKANKEVDVNNRIQKELKSFISNPPMGCKVVVGTNVRSWIITLTGVDGTLFEGEKFKLKVDFPKDYPWKPPSVYFLKPCPKHEHVYTNGDICLNLLGRDWRPTMTVETVAVSILSMLSSAREKTLPQDNAMHADATPGQQQDNWMYHDDRC